MKRITVDAAGRVVVATQSKRGNLLTRCRAGVTVEQVRAALRGVPTASNSHNAGRERLDQVRAALAEVGFIDLRFGRRAPDRHAIMLRPDTTLFSRIEVAAKQAGLPVTSWITRAIEARLE